MKNNEKEKRTKGTNINVERAKERKLRANEKKEYEE